MGEGAGIVVLEELEHAKARGAKIYAEIIGYGMSGDAYHITAPVRGRRRRLSLHEGGAEAGRAFPPTTSTTSMPMAPRRRLGDEIELRAVERLMGNKFNGLSMSSTKSSTGHLLGAAGAVEAIFSILAIRDNVVPPTLNLDNPSVETDIDLVPLEGAEKEINTVLSNSFGFGGTNASSDHEAPLSDSAKLARSRIGPWQLLSDKDRAPGEGFSSGFPVDGRLHQKGRLRGGLS